VAEEIQKPVDISLSNKSPPLNFVIATGYFIRQTARQKY
jgi:hypothetical protein